ncbi:hypothetical protein IGI04_008561 [Brassica rapa subsp. trilocularis]|uniref:NAC domain-containing protein n=2 Tax=Brassicaceae TaxID=3700 RepID=A0ABQ7NMZ0_BRACM|nr:hypothetical protein IGI04_008561 [Brassica rapa subsp. trilocularis]
MFRKKIQDQMESLTHIPPGYRFHPTDEELVDYYLKKKVAFPGMQVDVIKDVDLYKIEPWDIQELCGRGTGEEREWYFFSHKDKKYPTGTRTNRATGSGFWKATGRDKAIYSKQELVGMRKTLVFYKGRAPNGQKSDWIMHEYRLETDENGPPHEEGWVVCRAFKKKLTTMSYNNPRTMMGSSGQESNWFTHQMHVTNGSYYHLPDLESPRIASNNSFNECLFFSMFLLLLASKYKHLKIHPQTCVNPNMKKEVQSQKVDHVAMKPTKSGLEETFEQIQKIKITLSSKNAKNLEKVCADLVHGAKDDRLRTKGPVRMFTKEPYQHMDRFELRIHKRVIDLLALLMWSSKSLPSPLNLNQMKSFSHIPPGYRFHPTDDELVDYFLKKKVAFPGM